jgi:hypothetical protein
MKRYWWLVLLLALALYALVAVGASARPTFIPPRPTITPGATPGPSWPPQPTLPPPYPRVILPGVWK